MRLTGVGLRLFLAVFIVSTVIAGFSSTGRNAAYTGQAEGKVTAVYDGDTIKIRLSSGQESRVRLIGVDCPEMDDSREKVRLMAFVAKRYTYLKIYGRKVGLSFDWQKEDAYGRLLAYVRLEDGRLFNEIIIAEGFAYAYFKFPFDEGIRQKFKTAQEKARSAGLGLWADEPFPAVEPGSAGANLGKLASVTFVCERSYVRGRFRVIASRGGNFEAVIPRDILSVIPGDQVFVGRTIRVQGILEEYRGKPQIMIGVSSQLMVSGQR